MNPRIKPEDIERIQRKKEPAFKRLRAVKERLQENPHDLNPLLDLEAIRKELLMIERAELGGLQ